MIARRQVLVGFILAVLAIASGPTASAAAPHGHEAGVPSHGLTLDHGKKWPTDAPLREEMRGIRSALAAKLEPIHAGTLSADEYRALGLDIEKRVGVIVAKCKLPPAADANLHVVVAGLIAAADAMQGKVPAVKPAMGAERAVRWVDQYRAYFDDPGFPPLAPDVAHGTPPKAAKGPATR